MNKPVRVAGMVAMSFLMASSFYEVSTIDIVHAQTVTGTGTAERLPKWIEPNTLGNSMVNESASRLGVWSLNPSFKLEMAQTEPGLMGLINTQAPSVGGGPGVEAFIASVPTDTGQRLGFSTFGVRAVPLSFSSAAIQAHSLQPWIRNGTAPQPANFNITGNGVIAGTLSVDASIGTSGAYFIGGERVLAIGSLFNSDTAVGPFTLASNIGSNGNTAVGPAALNSNTTGELNAAVGFQSLAFNTTGTFNTAVGTFSLLSNTTAANNTAVGREALGQVTTASWNTAIGSLALSRATGENNTAVGAVALFNVTTGDGNTVVGEEALRELTEGSGNLAIGHFSGGALQTGSWNIYIGNTPGEADESATLRIGGIQSRAFVAGVRGVTTGMGNAIPVMIDSNGQLGTVSSSLRFKEDIHDMADASRRLFDLRPVTFRYAKPYADGSKPIQFGLVAEEVAQAFPELVVKNINNETEAVHYETLSVLLLNEVQRHQRQLAEERAKREELRGRIEALEEQLNELLRRR